jgi:hypothetical protein
MIEFIGPLYNLLQHLTNRYLRLDTLDFWPHYTNPLLSGAERSRPEAYCRQSAGTVTPGIGPRWDPWPYIYYLYDNYVFFFFLWGALSDERTEYLHRDPASRRRRQKGESQIWDSKIWSRDPRGSDQREIALARASSIYKSQTLWSLSHSLLYSLGSDLTENTSIA